MIVNSNQNEQRLLGMGLYIDGILAPFKPAAADESLYKSILAISKSQNSQF